MGVKKSTVKMRAVPSLRRYTAASSPEERPSRRSGCCACGNNPSNGRRTCANASGDNLEAHPAVELNEVSRKMSFLDTPPPSLLSCSGTTGPAEDLHVLPSRHELRKTGNRRPCRALSVFPRSVLMSVLNSRQQQQACLPAEYQ